MGKTLARCAFNYGRNAKKSRSACSLSCNVLLKKARDTNTGRDGGTTLSARKAEGASYSFIKARPGNE